MNNEIDIILEILPDKRFAITEDDWVASQKSWLASIQETRNEALEEAAKICDERMDLQIRTCGDERAIEAQCCAEAIRKLKSTANKS